MTAIPDLTVHFRATDTEQFQGRCTDLDSSDTNLRASVEFQGVPSPSISIGKKARLSFRGGGLVTNIDTEGLTVTRNDDQTRRRYSFMLTEVPKELLFVLANRRNAPRVRPDEEGLRVQILNLGGLGGDVELHDISSSGLSILLRPEVEDRLFNTVQVQLQLTLPESKSPLLLDATIRNRRLCGSAILYGLQFDKQAHGFLKAQESISKYLALFGG